MAIRESDTVFSIACISTFYLSREVADVGVPPARFRVFPITKRHAQQGGLSFRNESNVSNDGKQDLRGSAVFNSEFQKPVIPHLSFACVSFFNDDGKSSDRNISHFPSHLTAMQLAHGRQRLMSLDASDTDMLGCHRDTKMTSALHLHDLSRPGQSHRGNGRATVEGESAPPANNAGSKAIPVPVDLKVDEN
jgi:hypothetical protein